MVEYQEWLLTEDRHVATLTLNRPQAMNSLTVEALHELRHITGVLAERSDIWAVILQGQGKHFSSGVDLGVIQATLNQSEQTNREGLLDLQECLDAFEALEKPTIAKLHGFVIGGGLILALCCDFRFAGRRTYFSLPEVKLGIPVLMGTQRIVRAVGVPAAKEMILLGERFDAQRALAYGLVHRVVSDDALDAAVRKLADRFLALPPRTISLDKRLIDQGSQLTLRQSQDMEIEAQTELRDSPDLLEAMDSYLQKRRPRFSGH
jgi:enoyl-CoA hydratase/carnithine racemase